MLTTVGIVYGISQLLTSTTPDPSLTGDSQTKDENLAARLPKSIYGYCRIFKFAVRFYLASVTMCKLQ